MSSFVASRVSGRALSSVNSNPSPRQRRRVWGRAVEKSFVTQPLREAWSVFLVTHWRDVPLDEVGKAYGVSERTVEKWINQDNSPSGEYLVIAVNRDGFVIPPLGKGAR